MGESGKEVEKKEGKEGVRVQVSRGENEGYEKHRIESRSGRSALYHTVPVLSY